MISDLVETEYPLIMCNQYCLSIILYKQASPVYSDTRFQSIIPLYFSLILHDIRAKLRE